jgi:hypothetical protein
VATLVKPDGGRWTVAGDYVATLAKTDDEWKVTGIRFELGWQQGQP